MDLAELNRLAAVAANLAAAIKGQHKPGFEHQVISFSAKSQQDCIEVCEALQCAVNMLVNCIAIALSKSRDF